METLWWAAVTAANLATPLAVVSCTRAHAAVRAACAAAALAASGGVWMLAAGPAHSLRFMRVFASGEGAVAFVFAPWLGIVLSAAMVLAFPGCSAGAPPRSAPRALERRAARIGYISLCLLAILGLVYAFWSDLDEAACWTGLLTLQSAGLAWLTAGRRAASSPSGA